MRTAKLLRQPMWTWRSGRAHAFGDEGREFDPGSIRKGFCRRSRVDPSKRVLAHIRSTYAANAATHGTPSGEVASRCNPRHKGACNPQFLRTQLVVHRLHLLPLIWFSDTRFFLLYGLFFAGTERNELSYNRIFLIYGAIFLIYGLFLRVWP